jgi:DedD protein
MDERLRKRLIGAIVLMSLLVIFVPILIEKQNEMILDVGNVVPLPQNLPGLEGIPGPESFVRPVELSEPVYEEAEEVTEDEPLSAATNLDAWALQLASFSDPKRADALLRDLRKKSYVCYRETITISGKKHYRVRIGPEIDRSRLVAIKQKLQKELKLTGKIVRHKR